MLQLRTRAIILRARAGEPISLLSATDADEETIMRNLDTWTGGLFAIASLVLAVEAVLAF